MDARPCPPPGKGSAASTCTRYRADGSACKNPTDNIDGWCRYPECPGYRRANPAIAPDTGTASPWGTTKHIAESGDLHIDGIDLTDIPSLRVTTKAIDSFRYHHGGGIPEADTELRTMTEDFLLSSARSISGDGYVQLARQGFVITLSPDRTALVGYRTVHKERTWTQIKAGIPSRIRAAKKRKAAPSRDLEHEIGGPLGVRPTPGESVPNTTSLREILDAQTVYITIRATIDLSAIWVPHGPSEAREWPVRELVAEAFSDGDVARHDTEAGCYFTVQHRGLAWRISPDGLVLISVTLAQGHEAA